MVLLPVALMEQGVYQLSLCEFCCKSWLAVEVEMHTKPRTVSGESKFSN